MPRMYAISDTLARTVTAELDQLLDELRDVPGGALVLDSRRRNRGKSIRPVHYGGGRDDFKGHSLRPPSPRRRRRT